MDVCGINKEGFPILLELCTIYFAFPYTAIFDLAAGFQAGRLLVFVPAPTFKTKKMQVFFNYPRYFFILKISNIDQKTATDPCLRLSDDSED